ncbi:MAG: hypothetical protein RR935_02710, partial [Brevundimonas sp.]
GSSERLTPVLGGGGYLDHPDFRVKHFFLKKFSTNSPFKPEGLSSDGGGYLPIHRLRVKHFFLKKFSTFSPAVPKNLPTKEAAIYRSPSSVSTQIFQSFPEPPRRTIPKIQTHSSVQKAYTPPPNRSVEPPAAEEWVYRCGAFFAQPIPWSIPNFLADRESLDESP